MSHLLPRLAPIVLGLSLGACAQSAIVQNTPAMGPRYVAKPKHPFSHPQLVAHAHLPETRQKGAASYGVASYYAYDDATASGERFDPQKLTAAHRTLPFGTKLRVTDLAEGRSVVVRVNDRGPFIPGREVDLSYSAAQKIGMLNSGLAKVKIEILAPEPPNR